MKRYISFAILVLLFIITFVITQNSLYPLKANIPSDASSIATTIIVPGMPGPITTYYTIPETVTVAPRPTYTFTVTSPPETVTVSPGPTSTFNSRPAPTYITFVATNAFTMDHRSFLVKARDFIRYNVVSCKDCNVSIDFFVASSRFGSEDIIFRIISPDGREIFPKNKIYLHLYTYFIADQEGNYVLEFDNTYSDSDKIVLLAIAVAPSPQTTYKIFNIIPIILNIPILILIAILLLAIGILIGYLIKRCK
jgi:hypothetical protein